MNLPGAVPQVAAVIPALNEESSIGSVVEQIGERALAIVVDDGSTDRTAARARAAGAHVVSHERNRGYDGALETGLRTAIALGCNFAVTMDADGQHDPALLDSFVAALESGASLVVGERDRTQRWSEELFRRVGQWRWGLNDPLCGMKGYRLRMLAGTPDLNTYQSIGTELAVRLVKGGVPPVQPFVRTRPRAGVSRFGGGLKANLRIMRALWIGLAYARPITVDR